MDDIEEARQKIQSSINSGETAPEGQTWTTEEMQRDFEVMGFLAPFVVVRRRLDGQVGSLAFRHSPRIYFGWKSDRGE